MSQFSPGSQDGTLDVLISIDLRGAKVRPSGSSGAPSLPVLAPVPLQPSCGCCLVPQPSPEPFLSSPFCYWGRIWEAPSADGCWSQSSSAPLQAFFKEKKIPKPHIRAWQVQNLLFVSSRCCQTPLSVPWQCRQDKAAADRSCS